MTHIQKLIVVPSKMLHVSTELIIPPPDIFKIAKKAGRILGTCNRLKVGAVIWQIVEHGYEIITVSANASPLGHNFKCDTHGHLIVDNHCIRTAHAEMTALSKLSTIKKFHKLDSRKSLCMHVTDTPCPHCIKLSMMFGIRQITWEREYPNASGTTTFLEKSKFPSAQIAEYTSAYMYSILP